MAYNQWPGGLGSQVTTHASANTVEYKYSGAYQYVPVGIPVFLQDMGWNTTCNDPDTEEMLFQKQGDPNISTMYFRWYEAVAYEWFRMMTLGGE